MFTFKKINLTTIQIGRFKITRYRRKRQAQTPNTTDATGANNSRQPEALLTLGSDTVNPLATPTPSPSLSDSHASHSQSRRVIFHKTVPAGTPVSDTPVSPMVSTATASLLSPDTTATSTPTSTTTSTPPPTSTSAEDEFWKTNNRLGVLRKLRMSVFDFKVPTMTPLDHPDFWPSQLRDVVDIQSDYDETMSRPTNHINSRTKQFWQEVKHDFREQVDSNEEWVLPRFDERGARVFRNPNNQKALENSRAHHAQDNQDYHRQHQSQSQKPRSHQQWPQQPGSHNDSHLINHNNLQNGNKRLYPLKHSEIHTAVGHPQNHRYIPHDRFPHFQHSQQWGQQQQASQHHGQHFHGYQQPYGQNHHIEQHGYQNQRYQQHIDQQQSYHQAQRPNQHQSHKQHDQQRYVEQQNEQQLHGRQEHDRQQHVFQHTGKQHQHKQHALQQHDHEQRQHQSHDRHTQHQVWQFPRRPHPHDQQQRTIRNNKQLNNSTDSSMIGKPKRAREEEDVVRSSIKYPRKD